MTVYTWLVILLVAAALLLNGNKKGSKKFIIVAFLLLYAVMGLRDVYAFGSDASGSTGSYPIIYRDIGNTDWKQIRGDGDNNFNIGFNYLVKLIYGLTGGDYQLFISMISFVIVFSYMRFIDKYSPSSLQSILYFLGLLYYPLLFDVLKQALAMATLLFAFDAIIEKKPVKFIIITLLASSFHFPAIAFLPAFWIGRMKLGRGYIIVLAVLLLVTYLLRDQLLNLMMEAYGEGNGMATMEGIRFLRNKVIIMIAFTVFAVLISPPAADDTVYNALLMFIGIAVVFQTFSGYNNIFERLADYYFHTSIVFIPLISEKGIKKRSHIDMLRNKEIINAITLALCAFAIWRFLSYVNNAWSFNPYRFFWQH